MPKILSRLAHPGGAVAAIFASAEFAFGSPKDGVTVLAGAAAPQTLKAAAMVNSQASPLATSPSGLVARVVKDGIQFYSLVTGVEWTRPADTNGYVAETSRLQCRGKRIVFLARLRGLFARC